MGHGGVWCYVFVDQRFKNWGGFTKANRFKRNGVVVLLSYDDGQLISWVPWSTEFKHPKIIGYEDTFVDCYVESLVLIDKVANGTVTY